MNKEIVAQLLQATLSSDHTRVQAESQVQLLTREKGFSSILLEIFGDQSIDKSIRNLSIVLFKNIITNNWRRKDNTLFSEEEKQDYRNRVLLLLNNPNETCKNGVDILAGVIGTMARVDFPSNWPNLLTNLLELFEKSSSEQIKIVSLKTIKFVVKELASRRFVIDRTFFSQFSNTIFNYFIQIWRSGVKRLIELMIEGGNLAQHESFFILVYYVSKILRRVVEYGYTDYQNSPEICQYFSDIFTGLPEILKLRTRVTNPKILELVDKFIYINQKTIIKSQLQNPLTFINLLLPSLRFFAGQCLYYNPHDELKIEWNTTEDYQSVMTQSLNFLKQVIDCSSYQGDYLDSETDEKQSISNLAIKSGGKINGNGSIQIAQQTIKQFFNKELLSELLKALVSHYLIINREEVERWEDSPEEYIQELQVNDSVYELKPSAYNLFILLMRHFHQDSVSIVVSMLEFVTSPSFNTELTSEKICLKEACYMTIGLGYHDLMDIVNFSQVFISIFVPELHSADERFKIIKRRILWLVSYWVGKIPDQYKESVVKLLLEFLKNSDIVIALTALDALKAYIDDFNFDHHSYQPYLKETLESVIGLFSRSTNETTKSNLLSALASIFVKFNESIKPFSTVILQLFQHLWNGGKEQPIVKSAVLRSFAFFLQALNSDPADFYSLLFPIIEFSISQEDEKVYLLEDGLELWYRTMVLVPTLSQPQQPLIQMFKHWFTIIAQSLENSEICFKILDTYLLLGQIDFLKIYGAELSSTLYDIIGDLGEEYTELIVSAIMRIIQVVPNPQDSITLLIEQCLFKILSLIISRKETSTLVLIEYFSIFSRIMTMNPLSFFQLFDRYPLELLDKDGEYYDPSNFNNDNNDDDDDDDDGQSKIKEMPQNKSQLLQQFFEIYFDKIDSTSSSDQRKLIAIGLSNLLAIPREEVYPQIGEIITNVVGIRADISDITHDDIYCNDGDEVSGVQIQSDHIFQVDPLTTIDLSTYLYQKIQECSNLFGTENFQKAIVNVHPSILSLAIPPKN
ncbi:hypothetical protein DDB_G0279693 [Dictyostelium discoideum AX4]|uniref:Importin N-terminal domain-containing protein n=1 Tax=Dictyostelium discoideum TaxID=44689 RepID=Q54WF0_DICDI|nr:hypothetical protein DDB_G0279693 [Dictyostelium discoideum AX4]EAL67621.1 hypothetical protein DDB_G0279693 [Dictyostelium discoideum AX4]|eukprot:XP_641603.1 hypothetical protein DDB_G0279693 [Dictyostelium discoideum AX4]